jgi:hypothetical protein
VIYTGIGKIYNRASGAGNTDDSGLTGLRSGPHAEEVGSGGSPEIVSALPSLSAFSIHNLI